MIASDRSPPSPFSRSLHTHLRSCTLTQIQRGTLRRALRKHFHRRRHRHGHRIRTKSHTQADNMDLAVLRLEFATESVKFRVTHERPSLRVPARCHLFCVRVSHQKGTCERITKYHRYERTFPWIWSAADAWATSSHGNAQEGKIQGAWRGEPRRSWAQNRNAGKGKIGVIPREIIYHMFERLSTLSTRGIYHI